MYVCLLHINVFRQILQLRVTRRFQTEYEIIKTRVADHSHRNDSRIHYRRGRRRPSIGNRYY